MKSKVIGWNINQRSGMGKGIPQFVIDELIDQNADIIVLTELFQHSTIGYFWAEPDISTQSRRMMEQMKLEFPGRRMYTLFMQWMIRWLRRWKTIIRISYWWIWKTRTDSFLPLPDFGFEWWITASVPKNWNLL